MLGLVLLTMVGGLIYGEVYEAIRGGTVPLIDRPYIILQLMILEAPEPVPPEGALVAFWYIMPLGFRVDDRPRRSRLPEPGVQPGRQ